jgi:SPX domain protein involved in polyphosphate accumulation
LSSTLSSLRTALECITSKRRNAYRKSPYSTGDTTDDLAMLRNIYVELAALRSFCDLNQTGFYKIIKKYDKTMEVIMNRRVIVRSGRELGSGLRLRLMLGLIHHSQTKYISIE